MSLWREMLEEVYNEEEQQGRGVAMFEDPILRKQPVRLLREMLADGRAELSITGICCDLLNLRPELCAVLFVRDQAFSEMREMVVNWEYVEEGPAGEFGVRWNRIQERMKTIVVGDMVPSGVACLVLAREWLLQRHQL